MTLGLPVLLQVEQTANAFPKSAAKDGRFWNREIRKSNLWRLAILLGDHGRSQEKTL